MSFKEYYQHYLSLHENKICRRLHVTGQLTTALTLSYALFTQTWLLLLAVPFVVYPFTWTGHFLFEKNTPAAFSRPLWAKACDLLMTRDWILGRVER